MNLNIICRCCLKKSHQMFDIFDPNIEEKLKKCTTMQFQYNDNLPDKICNICLQELNKSYDFYLKCDESESALRIFFNVNNDEKLNSEFIVVESSNKQSNTNYILEEIEPTTLHGVVIEDLENKITNEIINRNYVDVLEEHDYFKLTEEPEKDNKNITNEMVVPAKRSRLKGPFKCDMCPRMYKNKFDLTIHLASHSTIKPFKCEICERTFPSLYMFRKHQRNLHATRSCNYCGQKIRIGTPAAFYNHMKSHRDNGDIDETKFKFSLKGVAKECDICKKYMISGEYKRHYESHAVKENSKSLLDGSFDDDDDEIYFSNKKYKNNESSYDLLECKKCKKTFYGKRSLQLHEWQAHEHIIIEKVPTNNEEDNCNKPRKCDECGKNFMRRIDWIRHYRLNHGNKPYKCEFCGKTFERMNYCRVHRRKHTGERPYICSICKKGFIKLEYLKNHLYCHKNEKIPCPYCAKLFKSPQNVKNHLIKLHPDRK